MRDDELGDPDGRMMKILSAELKIERNLTVEHGMGWVNEYRYFYVFGGCH
ncbi:MULTISPECIES: hypothetical protein [unclassified Thermococcus]|nr:MULTISPECIES: hypothetical protein [unclassified Thermococcus]